MQPRTDAQANPPATPPPIPSAPPSFVVMQLEPLEPRRLLAAWSDEAQLIRQDVAADHFGYVTGVGQTVVVIDSGINYDHPAMGGGFGPGYKVIAGWDFVDNDADPMDTYGHGTAVAGLIAADPYAAAGTTYQGIAPDAKLIALRIDRGGESVPDSRLEEALQWVEANRNQYNIGVVNISYGFGSYDEPFSGRRFGDEISRLSDAGVIVVAASGNNGVDSDRGMNFPAAHPDTISVAAVDNTDTFTAFSQRSDYLDVLAPGQSIKAPWTGNNIATVTGTSFAAPLVAGAIALARQIEPTLALDDVRSLLRTAGERVVDTTIFGDAGPVVPRLDLPGLLTHASTRRVEPDAEVGKFGNYGASAIDDQGVLHFVYYDVGELTLKYATRNTAGLWSDAQVVDNSLPYMGQFVDIALDSFGRPSIAYFGGFHGDLMYAELGTDGWAIESPDSKFSVGLYPQIAFDADDRPMLTYFYKTGGLMRWARMDARGDTANTWTYGVVDDAGVVGRSGDLAVDPDGNFAVAYAQSSTGHIRFAGFDADTNGWNAETIDDTTRGVDFISVAFDAQNRPTVSYFDAWPADLVVAVPVSSTASAVDLERAGATGWLRDRVATRGPQGHYSRVFTQPGFSGVFVLFYERKGNNLRIAVGIPGDEASWHTSVLHAGGGKFIQGTTGPDGIVYSYYDGATYSHVFAAL